MLTTNDLDNALITYSIECQFCGEKIEVEIDVFSDKEGHQQLADAMNEDGWEEIESDLYDMIGIACPACVSKEDKDR